MLRADLISVVTIDDYSIPDADWISATIGNQILFELQQSYQVQMSIQSILQGWSNASGLAVRVELAN